MEGINELETVRQDVFLDCIALANQLVKNKKVLL